MVVVMVVVVVTEEVEEDGVIQEAEVEAGHQEEDDEAIQDLDHDHATVEGVFPEVPEDQDHRKEALVKDLAVLVKILQVLANHREVAAAAEVVQKAALDHVHHTSLVHPRLDVNYRLTQLV